MSDNPSSEIPRDRSDQSTELSPLWQFQANARIIGAPFVHGSRIFVGVMTGVLDGSQVICLSRTTGETLFRIDLPGILESGFRSLPGLIACCTHEGTVHAFSSETGALAWKRCFDGAIIRHGPENYGSDLLVITAKPPSEPNIRILRSQDGIEQISMLLPKRGFYGNIWHPPLVGADSVFLVYGSAVSAMDLKHPKELWGTAFPGSLTAPPSLSERLWIGTDYEIIGLDPSSGKETHRFAFPQGCHGKKDEPIEIASRTGMVAGGLCPGALFCFDTNSRAMLHTMPNVTGAVFAGDSFWMTVGRGGTMRFSLSDFRPIGSPVQGAVGRPVFASGICLTRTWNTLFAWGSQ